MLNDVKDRLPQYGKRVLFYKPDGEWGKCWLIGHRAFTDEAGENWKSENHGGTVLGVTDWCEFPPLPRGAN